MRVMIALGGNALLLRGQPLNPDLQQSNVRQAALRLAEIARQHDVVVTHGNGPQIGLLALQSEAYREEVRPYPLDVLNAESVGMLGYLFEQELSNVLPGREIAALVTRVEVDRCDPAFACPTKPIGPVYTEQQAQRMASERGWAVGKDGNGFRRVVASPVPRRVLELRTIELLLHAGHIVVCAGGGGLPVTQADDGSLHGVEAVVDKDRTAALLAELLHVDRLLLLTDVAGIYRDWGGPRQQLFGIVTAEQLRSMDFDRGSMGPKVEAACQFVERTGKRAAIGALQDATRVLDGLAGTQICHSDSPCKHPGIEELG